ncbi:Vacuolar protein sorting-associated protein 1 [Grifola frondosa]|uniref:Vacuolar protein sorting-associated protein 1 n=1 Tax=Grifola frondosa TaxID=5627 RepID=A0A1C7MET3_GRIFR|nr:Vacuolar protein sorting-associated protein 1 [Grifola frondosa]
MLLKYISKPACIILAVTAANTDLANSDGLKLAREVDPEGRGLLVFSRRLTSWMLERMWLISSLAELSPATGLRPRRQSVLREHPSYKGKAQYCGTPFLARKLNVILMATFKFKPSCSRWRPLGDGNSANIVLSVITDFCSEFRTTIDGNTNDLSVNELSGGARISFVFHELFNNGIRTIDPFDQVKDGDIRTILYNSSGSTPSLFVDTTAFEIIVKQQIKRLEEPSQKCCQLVYDELIRILSQLLAKIQAFRRFPACENVAMQTCYVNTQHPDFLNGHKAMAIVATA